MLLLTFSVVLKADSIKGMEMNRHADNVITSQMPTPSYILIFFGDNK